MFGATIVTVKYEALFSV